MAGTSSGQSTSSYLSGLSPSFLEGLAVDITGAGGAPTTAIGALDQALSGEGNIVAPLASVVDATFGVDTAGAFSATADALSGVGALAPGSQPAWTFITAPEDISWSTANAANRVDIFGTNNPPLVAGSRGMRDLTLGNALVEGFVRRKQVEDKVAQLEALLNYGLNTSDGFVSVPVYQIWANKKSYGGAQGYFIIKDVRVKETMRDIQGNSTRAYVDVSLMQVPAYQVNSGRDQASEAVTGTTSSILPKQPAGAAAAAAPGAGDKAAQNAATAKVDGAKPTPTSGAAVPSQPPAQPSNTKNTLNRQNLPSVGDN
jgi:hypothetical protein